ncbi:MAG: chorismate mutase [Alphaproteobacteria bacterium]|nr:chorismate mutase [Alphaproteobacteria bacterium]
MTSDPSGHETLADLRIDIDRIDAALHQLLMERGEIIHRLIEAKARQGGGLAFRPSREADMMRALVCRHQGLLPLDTVESIWRIIISTFTFVQSNYSVHADISGGDAAMRDCCRFHFGFTVPYVAQRSAADVIAAVAKSDGDLGVVPVETAQGAWWPDLIAPCAPKIIARLPFVERQDHPAGLPVFILAQPLAEATVQEVLLYELTLPPDGENLIAQPATLPFEILARGHTSAGLSLLVSTGQSAAIAVWREHLAALAAKLEIAEIGSHAARFDASALQKIAAQ